MKERKARVEDALHATRAAVEEGIVPGGGVAYIRARGALDKIKGDNPDQEAGIKIVRRALEEPLRQMVANAGEDPSVVLNKVVEGEGNFGFNAQTEAYGDLVERSEEHTSELQSHSELVCRLLHENKNLDVNLHNDTKGQPPHHLDF